MIGFEFKAHPLMFFKIIKPYIFVLFLPFLRAFVQYLTIGKTSGTMFLEFMAIFVISVIAFFGYKSIKISVKGNRVTIKRGFLIKGEVSIDISHISSISTKQNLLDLLFGSVSCFINTEAGRPKKDDFNLKLYKKDAKILCILVNGSEKVKKISFSTFRIALLAAGTSSVLTGMIIAVPVVKKTGDIINVALTDLLLEQMSDISSKINNYLPSFVNYVTVFFVFAYMASFVITFFKRVKFRLIVGKKTIEIESGLITRKNIIFKKSKINNICFEQTFLMRILKKYSMSVSIAGYGNKKGERATVVPIGNKNSIKNQAKAIYGVFDYYANKIVPKQNLASLKNFLFVPMMIFLALITTVTVLLLVFPHVRRFILLFAFITLCFNLYYVSICYYDYKHSFVCFSDVIVVSASKKLSVQELCCSKNKVGVIKITQTPADKRRKTCKTKITVCSESADGARVRHIDLKSVIEGINRTYDVKINV